jgi:hypothetical protein
LLPKLFLLLAMTAAAQTPVDRIKRSLFASFSSEKEVLA